MMHEGLWVQLEKLEGAETARRAKCKYQADESGGQYVIDLLNRPYMVEVGKRKIYPAGGDQTESAGFIEQLCILAYLIQATDQPLRDKLVKAETLASGEFFFRGIHEMPTDKLAAAFGDDPKRLFNAIDKYNGRRCQYGDASMELYILPRIPITVVIWGGDEEFEARASMLFDQSAGDHIALDGLGAAADMTVSALIKEAGG